MLSYCLHLLLYGLGGLFVLSEVIGAIVMIHAYRHAPTIPGEDTGT